MDPSRVMVGQQPMPLVDNLPGEESVLLLNRGLFVVFVGGPYVDGPGTGVPLAPLGSLAVPADRQWWGVAEPAARDAQQAVYRVPGGTAYSPAPSEIAAQIASSQLAAQIGAAVPSAAQIGAAVPSASAIGAAVPSASAIGAAVPSAVAIGAAVPSASAIGAAVPSASAIGAAVPSASAIASAGYTTGSRAVDGPVRMVFHPVYPAAPPPIDVSQALSADLLWRWNIGAARATGTARAWAQLRMTWVDDTGALVQSEAYELCNQRPTVVGGPSSTGAIRCPALGRSLQLSFESTQYGAPALVNGDTADIFVLLSARGTDRVRYYPGAVQYGDTPGPAFTGVLYNAGPKTVLPGATAMFVLEPYSGPIDLEFYSGSVSIPFAVNFGAGGDSTTGNAFAMTFNPGTATPQLVSRLQGMRSQLVVTAKNPSTTVSSSAIVRASAADT